MHGDFLTVAETKGIHEAVQGLHRRASVAEVKYTEWAGLATDREKSFHRWLEILVEGLAVSQVRRCSCEDKALGPWPLLFH